MIDQAKDKLTYAGEKIKNWVSPPSSLQSDANDTADAAKEKADEVVDEASDKVEEVKNDVKDTAEDVGETV